MSKKPMKKEELYAKGQDAKNLERWLEFVKLLRKYSNKT